MVRAGEDGTVVESNSPANASDGGRSIALAAPQSTAPSLA